MRGQSHRYTIPSAVACLSLLLSFACVPAVLAQAPSAEQLNAIFSRIASPQEPGLAVVVRQNGRTLFERAYGMRDLRSALPIDAQTNFRLASFTKQFTAMSIMLLVHDGKLHYDDHLTDIFPDFPAYGGTITVRNLLNHTSGLIAYEDLMDTKYVGKQWVEIPQITDAGVLALAEQQTGTKFRPGSNWEYSNGGYCILGAIIAKVSGMSYADFLRQRIFAPLKMDHTVAHVYGKDEVSNRAYGYTDDAGTWLESDQSPTSATLGDGGVYTSLDDLAKWDDALRNHTLLSAAEMQPAITPVSAPADAANWPKADTGVPMAYGFGWFLDPYHSHTRMWHTGSSIGFRTVIERFTENNLTIIILSNRGDLDTSALALKAADLYFPPDAYPNSSEGLQDFLNSAIASAKSGDADKLTGMIKSTEIPNCPSWVNTPYAPDNAKNWMEMCDRTFLDQQEQHMREHLTSLSQQNGEIVVRNVNQSPEPGKSMESGILQALKQPVDVYFAEFRKADASSTQGDPIGYFLFIDGKFRLDSEIRFAQVISGPPPPPSNMLRMVDPTYPPEAMAKDIQGDVTLGVVIRKNGSVKILQTISGDPLLIPAAKEAVLQWRFKPKLLNGQPVEVNTRLVVGFHLYSKPRPN